MKTHAIFAALAVLLSGAIQSRAAITIPGADGSDGVLNITANTVIDLSQAVTGVWDANNTANAGKGIYDPSKWAVVFKYSSVTVNAGVTVTFKNHASRAPVVWLVSGNVTISGTVVLDGAIGTASPGLAEPGPGGFRGGMGIYAANLTGSAGLGVGGGGMPGGNDGYAGSYGSIGQNGPIAYGNPSLIPLIGGSGGSGTNSNNGNQPSGGGGGGGAILIACANTVSISGQLRANGGNGATPNYGGGSGSGGGIRLVTETFAGVGAVSALGGLARNPGGDGRIRIERANNSYSGPLTPPSPSVIPLGPTDTALLWPPADAPQVKIVSIGGQNIGADPLASFGTFGADAALPQTASTQVLIETTNVEQASQVKVRGTPRSNGTYTEVAATVSTVVSNTPLVVRWTATLPVGVGYSAVQVKVIRP